MNCLSIFKQTKYYFSWEFDAKSYIIINQNAKEVKEVKERGQ